MENQGPAAAESRPYTTADAVVAEFKSDDDPRFREFVLKQVAAAGREFVAIGLGLRFLASDADDLWEAIRERVRTMPTLRVWVMLAHPRHPGLQARLNEELVAGVSADKDWPVGFFDNLQRELVLKLDGEPRSRVTVGRLNYLPMHMIVRIDDMFLLRVYGPPRISGGRAPWIAFDGRNHASAFPRFLSEACEYAKENPAVLNLQGLQTDGGLAPVRREDQLRVLERLGFVNAGAWTLKEGRADFRLEGGRLRSGILYAFVTAEGLRYVGKSQGTLGQRMQGYKTPGSSQRTNVRVRDAIVGVLASGGEVRIWSLEDWDEPYYRGVPVCVPDGIEALLISALKPDWNKL